MSLELSIGSLNAYYNLKRQFKKLISGAICPFQGLLNNINSS
jgi:hypothetical protein